MYEIMCLFLNQMLRRWLSRCLLCRYEDPSVILRTKVEMVGEVVYTLVIPAPEKRRQEDSWSLLAS